MIPCNNGWSPPSRKLDANNDLTSSTLTGPYATRPFGVSTSTNGSSQSIPLEPLRIMLTLPFELFEIAFATSSEPTDKAAASHGTKTLTIMAPLPLL